MTLPIPGVNNLDPDDYPRHDTDECDGCGRAHDCGAVWCAEIWGDECPDHAPLPLGGVA